MARLAPVAPLAFVLLWSTGFIGTKFGTPYAQPFIFLAVRFAIAAGLLALAALGTRSAWPRGRAQWGHAAVAGLLLHGVYLGGVFVAIHRQLPAGITAVVVGVQPLLTALLSGPLLGERVHLRQWGGLALGFVGVLLVVAGREHAQGGFGLVALLAAGVGLLGTTFGTLYQRRHGGGVPLLTGTVAQYLAATAFTGLLALAFEDTRIQWTLPFALALAWLVLGLSVGAILLLLSLIRSMPAARVSSLFFLVPPLTAVQAYLLFGERLAPVALTGMAACMVGVAVAMRPAPERAAYTEPEA